ncbi:hypothetical protein [Faecalicoccus pleomorphus]|uniref:Uncharacterized protein n=1 Tax=Faecalicoccus pleomorphus TaxID=1323 RepID=A0A380LR28_9FIRM|nr:hypothetical protein [Faecalicoccus pleomorphus]MBM6764984.1 hypothetical protein [Faecalicoccus pleomorphus]MBM6808814.1 hypothetical protein [Faecalicoccus pleomorphus]SUO05040.1 Uncharacterised protein [Faecalicoccus pleomorphus]
MWLLCTAFSLVFTIAHIGHRVSKRKGSVLLLVLSLLSVILNLLSIYIQIAEWIRYQDWLALEDVVPTMQPILFIYVLCVVLINLFLYHGNKGYKAYK